MNWGYVLKNAAANLVDPLVPHGLRRQRSLGMDGDPSAVIRTLDELAEGLVALDGLPAGASVLELGPGRTPHIAMALILSGAQRAIGLDTLLRLPADWDAPATYRQLTEGLAGEAGERFRRATGTTPAAIRQRFAHFEGTGLLPLQFGTYDGASTPLPDGSVDLIFSKSVLEHVATFHVTRLLAGMHAVLRADGAMVHLIDLRDHMWIDGDDAVTGDWLDALRYPEPLFRAMFSNRDPSINRLRATQWYALFDDAGFDVAWRREVHLPMPDGFARDRLQAPWRLMSEADLRVGRLAVALRKRRGPG